MSVAVIIDRISTSLAAGELAPSQEPSEAVVLATVGDLLRPWDEVYPGCRQVEDDVRDLSGWGPGHLQKPRFHPQPRVSRRPLPLPRRIAPPRKPIGPALFESLSAVWQWYLRRGLAAPELPLNTLNAEGLNAFVQPLYDATVDFYPLCMCLEEFGYGDSLHHLGGVCLILPHYFWEDEAAGVFEAFLSGWEGLDWLLRELCGRDDFLNVPEEDSALVKVVGCSDLARCYAEFEGKKRLDVVRLGDWTKSYFGDVTRDYPQYDVEQIPVIVSDPHEVEAYITVPEDIDFCLAYAKAYEAMTADMPYPFDIEHNEQREADELVHDVCEVWRKKHRKKSIPLGRTLVEVFREQ